MTHPRSRRENIKQIARDVEKTGSSPLTRGKLGACRAEIERVRLIPTRAGKTGRTRTRAKRSTAHPHSRGENFDRSVSHWPLSGSSPLAWGKQNPRLQTATHVRLIPAHARKTRRRPPGGFRARAHPRSRGENTSAARSKLGQPGSSPLMRGKRRYNPATTAVVGLIPAHTGKTRNHSTAHRRPEAHPRSRGENFDGQAPGADGQGSSPLTWGKCDVLLRALSGPGLIPAHTGKTRSLP